MIWIKNININLKNFINKRALHLNNDNILINKTNDNTNNDINIIKDINTLIYKNPFTTRQMIIDSIYDKYKVKLTLNKVSKIFKKLKLTRKKPKFHVVKSEKYLDELIEKRKKFKIDVSKIDINKIISIDESSFNNFNNNNGKGLSKKGTVINMPCNEKKVKNTSLICAVSVDKILYYETCESSVNSEVFYNYINNLITKNELKGCYFMIDNVRFHHCKKTLK